MRSLTIPVFDKESGVKEGMKKNCILSLGGQDAVQSLMQRGNLP